VTIRWLLTGLLAVTLGLTGCSGDDDCRGQSYHPDLDSKGDGSPIAALETWLQRHEGLSEPPDDDWIQVDSGDPEPDQVVIQNDTGDGWWVSVSRTSQDGWVVTQATDDATACGDELSG
jgi:hypothetical protein